MLGLYLFSKIFCIFVYTFSTFWYEYRYTFAGIWYQYESTLGLLVDMMETGSNTTPPPTGNPPKDIIKIISWDCPGQIVKSNTIMNAEEQKQLTKKLV